MRLYTGWRQVVSWSTPAVFRIDDWSHCVIDPRPVTLERDGIRLEPLSPAHHDGLVQAASDGELWKLWFTSVPEPGAVTAYIADAEKGRVDGHMLPWAVRDLT